MGNDDGAMATKHPTTVPNTPDMPDRPPSRSGASTPKLATRDPRQRSKSTGGSVVGVPAATTRRPNVAGTSASANTNANRRSTIASPSNDATVTPRVPKSTSSSTLRPSSEYRYSIGPAPVRFPTREREEEVEPTASSSKLLPPLTSPPPTASPTPKRPTAPRRPSSKVLTTFPFPHPTTPKGAEDGGETKRLGFAWVTSLFTRHTPEDEERQPRATQPLLTSPRQDYGTLDSHSRSRSSSPTPTHSNRHSRNNTSLDSYPDPSDPYGYRRLAGPSLLPEYHTQHVEPRRRKRSGVSNSWITRQKRLTALFTLLCLIALFASALGWWVARGEDLRGRVPGGGN